MFETRIIFLGNSTADTEGEELILRKSGIAFQSIFVNSLEIFSESLRSFKPDLILAVHPLVNLTVFQALTAVKESQARIPFIIITGIDGESVALQALTEGASDYLFKDRLARLPMVVLDAIEENRSARTRNITEEEQQFRTIFENALDGIVLIDETGKIVDCNPEFERQTGRPLNQLRELHIWEIRPPDKSEMAKRVFSEIFKTGTGESSNLDFQKPDGSRTFIEFRAARITIGGKTYLQSIARDITRRIEEEKLLIQSERNLKEAQKIARLGSWELNLVTNVLIWSDEIYRIFEIDPQKFGATYEAFLNAIHPDDRELVNRAYTESVANHTQYDIIHRLMMKDGRIKFVNEICQTSYDESGKPLKSVGTVQDITLQHEAELNIFRLNRTLRTISACNESLVRAKSEDALLGEICQHIVEIGGYMLAWVGSEDGSGNLLPVSSFGDQKLFHAYVEMCSAASRSSICLAFVASREQRTIVQNHLVDGPKSVADDQMKELGVNAILALPLLKDGDRYGVLSILSDNSEAFDRSEIDLMEELSADIGYGISALRTMKERDEYQDRYSTSMEQTIAALGRTIEMRDPYTAGHQMRVAHLAKAIAGEIGLSKNQIEGIYLAGIVHDIGKIQIPAEILGKPGRLSDLDYDFIRTHPQSGYEILKDIEFPWPIARIVLQHHERWDGSGYPNHLVRDEILLEARILHVADVVEALSSHRPYRPSLGIEKALDELSQMSGFSFDPNVVNACLSLFREKGYTFISAW